MANTGPNSFANSCRTATVGHLPLVKPFCSGFCKASSSAGHVGQFALLLTGQSVLFCSVIVIPSPLGSPSYDVVFLCLRE